MREINHRRLRYFHEVLVRGTIRGAADELNTAPSVIARQIALLEEELGFALFERQPRGMLPTEGARHLQDYWKACQAQQELLVERLSAETSMEAGSVRIVASEGVVESLLAQVLGPFFNAHPKVSIELDALPMTELLESILEDSAHIAIAYNPPAEAALDFVASAPAPAKLLVREGHPLTQLPQPISLRDITAFPLALMPPMYGLGRLAESLEYAEQVKFKPALRSNSTAACRQFVRSTNGVTFVGTGVAAPFGEFHAGLVELDVDHALCGSAQARLIVRKGRMLPPAAARVLTEIEQGFSMFNRAAP